MVGASDGRDTRIATRSPPDRRLIILHNSALDYGTYPDPTCPPMDGYATINKVVVVLPIMARG
jgi:hypothetical protein